MITVAVFEAKTRLSELLVQVQQGEEVTITRHGVPMARLVPVAEGTRQATGGSQRQRVAATFKVLAGLRQGVTLDMPLRDAIGTLGAGVHQCVAHRVLAPAHGCPARPANSGRDRSAADRGRSSAGRPQRTAGLGAAVRPQQLRRLVPGTGVTAAMPCSDTTRAAAIGGDRCWGGLGGRSLRATCRLISYRLNTFPGFMMFFGSSARFTDRIISTAAGPASSSR